jgi:hypothetical protein
MLVAAIARGRRWVQELTTGQIESVELILLGARRMSEGETTGSRNDEQGG